MGRTIAIILSTFVSLMRYLPSQRTLVEMRPSKRSVLFKQSNRDFLTYTPKFQRYTVHKYLEVIWNDAAKFAALSKVRKAHQPRSRKAPILFDGPETIYSFPGIVHLGNKNILTTRTTQGGFLVTKKVYFY